MRSAPSTDVVSVIDRVVSVLASFRVDDETGKKVRVAKTNGKDI